MTTRAIMTRRRGMLIEVLRENGGAASSWRVARAVGNPSVSQPALWRAAAAGIVKRVDGTTPDAAALTPGERERLGTAVARQPRAYAFWVLTDAYA